jgi:hypothetical protein
MTLWRWCAAAALLTIAIGLGFAAVPGIDACGSTPPGDAWPTLQRALQPADMAAVIRPGCDAALIPALHTSMWLDAVFFIPAYVAFLLTALLALRPQGPRLFAMGAFALLAGVVADQSEGLALRSMLIYWPAQTDAFGWLAWSYNANVFFLGANTLAIGGLLWAAAGWQRAMGVAIIVASLAAMTVRIAGDQLAYAGLAASWMMVLVVALVASFERERA